MSATLPGFLAALGIELPKQNRSMGKLPGLLLSDVLVIVGVGLGLLAILVLAVYLRAKLSRRRRHISGGEKVYRSTHVPEPGTEPETEAELNETEKDSEDDSDEPHHHHHHHHGRRRYKYRVRRRTHRTRNPTLSETGGLPPVKAPEASKPS